MYFMPKSVDKRRHKVELIRAFLETENSVKLKLQKHQKGYDDDDNDNDTSMWPWSGDTSNSVSTAASPTIRGSK